MMTRSVTKSDLLRRIRAEYTELPGMALTEAQFKRLWGLDAGTCHALLEELLRSGFLRQTRSRGYVRNSNY